MWFILIWIDKMDHYSSHLTMYSTEAKLFQTSMSSRRRWWLTATWSPWMSCASASTPTSTTGRPKKPLRKTSLNMDPIGLFDSSHFLISKFKFFDHYNPHLLLPLFDSLLKGCRWDLIIQLAHTGYLTTTTESVSMRTRFFIFLSVWAFRKRYYQVPGSTDLM